MSTQKTTKESTTKQAYEVVAGDVIVVDGEEWTVKDNTTVYKTYAQFLRVGRTDNGVSLSTGFVFNMGTHVEVK